jgi:RND family efflux transporter MFP subunit
LEPTNQATLVAKRQGQVTAVLAEEGAWVHKGQVLAKIDETEAKLALDKAQIGNDVAKREMERGKQLKERGMISAKELDDLDLKMRSAWQELEQARYDMSQTRITAPFSGRVLERMIHLGETVNPGNDCYRLADMTPLRARVYFPERELARVRSGQKALLETDTQPGQKYVATVSIVNPSVDLTNGTFKVTLEVIDKTGALRPGTFCRMRLQTGTYHDAIVIPRRALLSEDGEDFVFLARADSVNRVKVKLGAISGDTAQILAGIAAGDSVVTVGQGGLKQGAKIKPVRS